jgi:hypothetical protein
LLGLGGSLASPSISIASGATMNVAGVLPITANVSVAGILNFAGSAGSGILNRTLAAINLSSGATVAMGVPTASANRTVLVLGSLQFGGTTNAWQGVLDLSTNDLILRNGSAGVIANQLKQAYSGGSWAGTGGITSSAAGGGNLTTLGYRAGGSTFDGLTTTGSDVVVKFTYYGDANLDGKVDGSDYSLIDSAFLANQSHPGSYTAWSNGDFNYDGVIDGSDYTLIDNAFNTQGVNLTASVATVMVSTTAQIVEGSAAVPEPASTGLLTASGLALLARRRRRA